MLTVGPYVNRMVQSNGMSFCCHIIAFSGTYQSASAPNVVYCAISAFCKKVTERCLFLRKKKMCFFSNNEAAVMVIVLQLTRG